MPGMDAIVSIGFEGGLQDEWASKRGLQEGSGAAPRDQSAEGEAIVSEVLCLSLGSLRFWCGLESNVLE